MDESDAKATLAEIETVGGAKHEAGIKGDRAVLVERENCYKVLFPEQATEAPQGDPTRPASSSTIQPPAVGEPPTDTTPDDYDTCFAHLRHEWPGDKFDQNLDAALKARDWIFPVDDKESAAIFENGILNTSLANDPRLLSALSRLADRLPVGPPTAVNIDDIPYAKREELALVAASFVLGNTQGKLQDNPILRQLASVIPAEDLIAFGCRLHKKLFKNGGR